VAQMPDFGVSKDAQHELCEGHSSDPTFVARCVLQTTFTLRLGERERHIDI
jgi:hypothetical protein